VGSLLAISLGACSGVFLGVAGEMAGEGSDLGASLLLFAIGQTILGLVAGIMAYNKMKKNLALSVFEKFGLFVAAAFSLSNTFVFFTGGACHIIAGVLAVLYKPGQSK